MLNPQKGGDLELAQLRNRGSNVWQIQVFLGKDVDAKKKCVYETFYGTKPNAKLYANKLEIELKSRGTAPKSASMTISDLLSQWLDDVKRDIEKSTLEQYQNHSKRLIEVLGDLQLYNLDSSQIKIRLAKFDTQNLSTRTIKNFYRSLRTAINWGMREKLVNNDVMFGIKPPKNTHVVRKVLKGTEVINFLEIAKGYKHYLPVRILALTGMRIGELMGLKWKNTSLEGCKVKIIEAVNSRSKYLKDTKTQNSKREITLDTETIQELRKHKVSMGDHGRAEDEDYVFQSGDRGFLKYDAIFKTKNRVLKKAGLHHIRIHDLRHGVGSILLDRGVSITGVAEQLGQVPATTAAIYGHALRHGCSIVEML